MKHSVVNPQVLYSTENIDSSNYNASNGDLQIRYLRSRNSLNQRNEPFVPVHILNLEPAPPQDLGELPFCPLQSSGHVHHMGRDHVLKPIAILVQQDLGNVQPASVVRARNHVPNVLQDLDTVVFEPIV